ncbi:unnamed protein product, partial [Timema podura]|nr:unnamed protein product [Timema podura]
MEGPVEPAELLQRLRTVVSENEIALIAARADRSVALRWLHQLSCYRGEGECFLPRVERSFNQTLREQQDQAYLESLQADQEKERRRLEEREKKEDAERHIRELEQIEIDRKEDIRQQKINSLAKVPDEPPSDDPDAVHVVIKLPNGLRLERRFLPDHSLEVSS